MTIPEGFKEAHDGLIGLVRRVASGEVQRVSLPRVCEADVSNACKTAEGRCLCSISGLRNYATEVARGVEL